ncbi:hypothetical protein SLA2020_355940 [Shorea laevis]
MATVEKRAADFRDPGVDYQEEKKLQIDEDCSSKQNKSLEAGNDPDSECIRFHKQIHDSDGFDVDAVLPDDIMSYFGVFNDLNKVSPTQLQECEEFAREAIKLHNLYKKPENANLEYVKLVKFNMEFEFNPDGEMFYLAFEAKDTKDGSIQSRQAKVFAAYSEDPEIMLFYLFVNFVYLDRSQVQRALSLPRRWAMQLLIELYIDLSYRHESKEGVLLTYCGVSTEIFEECVFCK